MPTEVWVDSVDGDDANPGTEASPYQTVYRAVDANRNPADNSLIVNVVPANALLSTDTIRITQLHNAAATFCVRSASSPTKWTCSNDTSAEFIQLFNDAKGVLVIQDADVTCRRIVSTSGTTPNRSVEVELEGSTEWTHSRDNVEPAFRYLATAAPASVGKLTIKSGCSITGWQTLITSSPNSDGSSLGELSIDGLVFDSGTDANNGANVISSPEVSITNSTFTFRASNANSMYFLCNHIQNLTISGCSWTSATASGHAIRVEAPTAASLNSGCNVVFSNNTVTMSAGGFVQFGRDLIVSSDRATNDATATNFQSVLVENNTMTQAADGPILNFHAGADNSVARNNFIRVGTLGTTANVHQIYLYARNVLFENNFCASNVLAFGPEQRILNNLIVANRCILLGGTQGGGQPIGGGNDYTIRRNAMIAVVDDCYSDYSFNSAYPTNLGDLTADINSNQYVVLSGANAIAKLTESSLEPTTMAELRNVWQNSALSGSGTVYGTATNAGNDSRSAIVGLNTQLGQYVSGLCVNGATLTRQELEAAWRKFVAVRGQAVRQLVLFF
jgi:hypothetical protein